jgi:hypothetical protein
MSDAVAAHDVLASTWGSERLDLECRSPRWTVWQSGYGTLQRFMSPRPVARKATTLLFGGLTITRGHHWSYWGTRVSESFFATRDTWG